MTDSSTSQGNSGDHETRQLVIKSLITVGLVGVGFLSGGALTSVIIETLKGIGGNWISNLTEDAFHRYCDQWFTHDGVLNHDLRKALARAFQGAAQQVQQDWVISTPYKDLDEKTAQLTLKPLKWLREDATDLFDPDIFGDELDKRQDELVKLVQSHDRATVPQLPENILTTVLDVYLADQPSSLRDFIEERLITSWLLRFREELKNDEQARTAYENLWQTSISDALDTIKVKTTQTADDVEALLLMVDSLQQELQKVKISPDMVSSEETLTKILRQQIRPHLNTLLVEIRAVKRDTEQILSQLDEIKERYARTFDPATQEIYRQKELALAKELLASMPLDMIPDPDPASLSGISRMLYKSNPLFVGRADDLKALAVAFNSETPSELLGKTMILAS